jgi:nicotinamide phosphoribosyltransferase
VPAGNVLVTIVNTDPDFAWLTSVLETSLLRAVWYPTTVATISFRIKRLIKEYLEKTADSTDGIDFKLNDFGSRGVSSLESSIIGGLAHLAVFKGTDNMAAVRAARQHYHESMAGFSIPASEHSVMTSWGGREGEVKSMANVVDRFGGKYPLVACVSDSYDIFNAAENLWGGELLEKVRASGSTIVVRPDSGDPVETPVRVIEILMERAGFTTNSKGYKVLPPYFRVIQGDGIDEVTIGLILREMEKRGLSAENIAFGMGGALLQKLDRDTNKFAMKCSSIEVDGSWIDVYKEPVGQADKRSKRGRLALVREDGRYKTVRVEEVRGWRDQEITCLELVYRDGDIRQETDLAQVRAKVNSNL